MSVSKPHSIHTPHLVAARADISHINSNYIRFVTGDYDGLTLVSKTDANTDSGFTATDGGFHEVAWDGDGAGTITLPPAKRGAIVIIKLTAQCDGGQNLVINCGSGDTFKKQTLSVLTQNAGDGIQIPRVIGSTLTSTFGTVDSSIAAAHNRLTIASTATDNQTNIGAELSFYSDNNKKWRIAFKGSELGSGVINAGGFAGSTA